MPYIVGIFRMVSKGRGLQESNDVEWCRMVAKDVVRTCACTYDSYICTIRPAHEYHSETPPANTQEFLCAFWARAAFGFPAASLQHPVSRPPLRRPPQLSMSLLSFGTQRMQLYDVLRMRVFVMQDIFQSQGTNPRGPPRLCFCHDNLYTSEPTQTA